MVKILSSRNNQNSRIKKNNKDPNKKSKQLFLRLILLLFSMRKDSLACQIKQNLLRLSMLSGVFIDLSFNMTIFSNGWEPKLELLWDTRPKSQMLGWMENSQEPDLDFKNYFRTNSMTISTNSCLKTSFTQLSLSLNVIQFLQPVVKLQFQVNQY